MPRPSLSGTPDELTSLLAGFIGVGLRAGRSGEDWTSASSSLAGTSSRQDKSIELDDGFRTEIPKDKQTD